MEQEIDRHSYDTGYMVSKEVYLKRVKELLEKERERYTTHTGERLGIGMEGAYLALTHAIKAVETLL